MQVSQNTVVSGLAAACLHHLRRASLHFAPLLHSPKWLLPGVLRVAGIQGQHLYRKGHVPSRGGRQGPRLAGGEAEAFVVLL